jgi:hypothetical protein
MLSLELITSPLKKQSKIIFGSPINDSEKDEERTCLDELEVREEESLIQQLGMTTLRKNLNLIWIR